MILSDLHFGNEECLLNDEKVQSSFFRRLREYTKDKKLKEVVLLGDIFDFWVQEPTGALEASKDFFEGLWELDIGKITYVPGNHDHHLKVVAWESFSLPSNEGVRAKMEDFTLHLKDGGILREIFSKRLGMIADIEFEVGYPAYELDIGKHHVLLTHGHFFDKLQTLSLRDRVPQLEKLNVEFERYYDEEEVMELMTRKKGLIETLDPEERERLMVEVIAEEWIKALQDVGLEVKVMALSDLLEGSSEVAEKLEKYFTWIYEGLYRNALYEGIVKLEKGLWIIFTKIFGGIGYLYRKMTGKSVDVMLERVLEKYPLIQPTEEPTTIIFGHTHRVGHAKKGSKIVINSGSWVGKSGDIVLLEEGKAKICSFDYRSGELKVHEQEILLG